MAVFNTFTFDGENSLDYGVYITGEAVYNAPERAVEMVSIPGKNGALALDQGRFENIEVTYPAGTFGVEQTEFAGRMRAMRNMLASRYNYVRLTDSYHPDEYRLGLYKNGLEVTPVAMSSAGEFNITFNCKPQRFLTSGEEPVDTSELGGDVTTDKIPYLFRRSGGGDIGHDFDAEIDKIIGGTVAWNQQIYDGNFSTGTGWQRLGSGTTISVANNECTITINSDYGGLQTDATSGYLPTDILGHKYLISATLKASSSRTDIGFGISSSSSSSAIRKRFAVGTNYQTYSFIGVQNAATVSGRFMLYAENGSDGVTLYAKNIFAIDLTQAFGTEIADYVYNLEQTTAGSGIAWLKSHGFIDGSYRAFDSGSLQSVKTSAHKTYDADNNVIGNYALDSDLTLRGIPKLDASNNLYYDGDTYESDGTVTRKYGIVDLGTLNYINYKTGGFRASLPLKDATSSNVPPNILMANYQTVPSSATLTDHQVTGFNNNIYIVNTNYGTDPNEFKQGMSGVYLVYELATPTTEQADPYANPQVVNPLGTEEYVDTRDVPVPVGHETKYGMSQLVLSNPTEFPSKPLLEVMGVGTFWLGDTQFTITGTEGQTIYIDCETGEAWKNTGGIIMPANGLVSLNRLDFPELDPGDNPVMYGTGITKVVVTPRWWRL